MRRHCLTLKLLGIRYAMAVLPNRLEEFGNGQDLARAEN